MRYILLGALLACGDSTNGTGKVSITASALDFGEVDCGTSGTAQAIEIANTGAGALSYTATLASGAAFTVTPPMGTVEGNSELTVLVVPKAVPNMTATTAITDTLTITTDVKGDSGHAVSLTMTPHGAIVAVSSSSVVFAGTSKVGQTSTPQAFTITNNGNAPTTLTVAVTDESFAVDETSATVAPGASVDRSVTLLPVASGALQTNLVINASGPLCAAIPSATAQATGTFGGTAVAVHLVGPAQQRSNTSTLCAVLSSGHVACLGGDRMHARGAGTGSVTVPSVPNLVRTDSGALLDSVVELASGRSQVCARRNDGSVWCWGNVGSFKAKDGDGNPFAVKQIAAGATSVSGSYGMMCALVGGNVQCTGNVAQRWTNVDPTSWVASGTQLAMNGGGGYVLQADGSVQSFGNSNDGARGNASGSNTPASAVTGIANATQLVGSVMRNGRTGGGCALINDGTVQCWGDGRHGKNGNNTENNLTTPAPVVIADGTTPLGGVTQLASGRSHRCAITPTNVFCWGRGDFGELGVAGASENTLTAVPLDTAIANARSITAQGRGTCVARADGGVTCFGATPLSAGPPVDVAAFAP